MNNGNREGACLPSKPVLDQPLNPALIHTQTRYYISRDFGGSPVLWTIQRHVGPWCPLSGHVHVGMFPFQLPVGSEPQCCWEPALGAYIQHDVDGERRVGCPQRWVGKRWTAGICAVSADWPWVCRNSDNLHINKCAHRRSQIKNKTITIWFLPLGEKRKKKKKTRVFSHMKEFKHFAFICPCCALTKLADRSISWLWFWG